MIGMRLKYKVTEISAKAFKGKKIKKVKMGKNIKKIGKAAFKDCTKLTSVEMDANIESIVDMAFYNCSSLTSLTIPAKTVKLAKQFAGKCKKLKKLNVKSRKLTAKTISVGAFKYGNTKGTVTVLKGMAKTYKPIFQKKGLGKKNKVK